MYVNISSHSRQRRQKISEAEFNLTTQFLQMLDLYIESDYTIMLEPMMDPLTCGTKLLGFAERYSSLNKIPRDMALFRPFRNEAHTNIIIELFEELNYIEFDSLEINEYEKDGKIKYSGRLIKDGKTVEGSFIKTSPSAAILKMSILATLLMDEDEHREYMENLMLFLRKGGRNETNENV